MQFTGSLALRLALLMGALTCALTAAHADSKSDSFYLLYRHWQPYEWPGDSPPADDISRAQRGLGWHRSFAAGDLGLDYDYQPLRIRTGEPAHNGHLHRFMVSGQWLHGLYRLQFGTGLAGTSNMFVDQRFHREALNGRLALFRSVQEKSPLSLGIGGDHRFGSFRWLPRVRWEQTNRYGNWLVDLPVLVQWQGPGRHWGLRLERNGDRWATLDQDEGTESALYLQEWRLELSYRVSAAHDWRPGVSLGIGASVNAEVRYQDSEAGFVELELGEALFGSVRLDW